MNKEVATILKNKLIGLPFVEVLWGMVQTVTREVTAGDPDDPQATYLQKMPVTYDWIAEGVECNGQEYAMVPNSLRRSIIYFEDFGGSFAGR